MNRQMRRLGDKEGRRLMNLPENDFQEIPYSELVLRAGNNIHRYPNRAWKNNHYVVQLYRCERHIWKIHCDKLMIRRNDSQPIREWHALQDIKNKICGEEVMAIQCFPKQSELVDVANMYWLFIETGIL